MTRTPRLAPWEGARGAFGLSLLYGAALVLIAGAGAGLAAFVVGQAGLKAQVAAGGALCLAFSLLVVRERSLLLLMVLILGLQMLMHKALGPINPDISSGPQAVYLMTVDVVVVALYALWFFEGTLVRDLGRALTQRVIWLPLLAGLAVAPSLLMVQDVSLAAGELFRAGWAYALYVYVALRVRTRREAGFLLGALLLVALVQSALVVAQWRTGSALGLSFLGEESELGVRSLDDGDIPRPSGTVIHAVLLGALLGPIALMLLSLAINLRPWQLRLLCLGGSAVAVVPIAIAQTRGAAIGLGVSGLLLVGASLLRGRLSWRPVAAIALLLAVAAVPFRDQIEERIFANLGTEHFLREVESRLELNQVAVDMIADYPVFGVGLNNFEIALESYDTYGLIFFGHPVHNLFLLVFAEAGVIGLAGLLALLGLWFRWAWRLARTGDRFLGAVGAGVAAVLVFFIVEEQLMFSLRHDMPRTLLWLLAGLVVACWRMTPGAQALEEAEHVA